MKIIKLKKNFEDKRGYISDLFYKKNINHITLIFSKKGSIRGNNYFKKNYQYIYNLGSTFEYWYKDLKNKKIRKKLIKKNQLVETPPFEIHTLKFKKNNQLIEFSTLSFRQKTRLNDSVRYKLI